MHVIGNPSYPDILFSELKGHLVDVGHTLKGNNCLFLWNNLTVLSACGALRADATNAFASLYGCYSLVPHKMGPSQQGTSFRGNKNHLSTPCQTLQGYLIVGIYAKWDLLNLNLLPKGFSNKLPGYGNIVQILRIKQPMNPVQLNYYKVIKHDPCLLPLVCMKFH